MAVPIERPTVECGRGRSGWLVDLVDLVDGGVDRDAIVVFIGVGYAGNAGSSWSRFAMSNRRALMGW